jgi:hypothetical protein
MTTAMRALPSLTPMHRGRLPARSCRHERVDGLHRPSGRNASKSGITPSTIMSPARSQIGSRTEIRLGARAHTAHTLERAHAPPETRFQRPTPRLTPRTRTDKERAPRRRGAISRAGSPVGRRASPRGGRGELANAALRRGTNERVGLHRWSSAPRSKLRTRSASPARPVSTMIGSSGSIREASPSAARTRSITSRPLPPSSLRSSSTRQGRRTSIARSPSAALEALATRKPSAARLSARNPLVASSSSITRISPCSSTPAGSTARENLAPTRHHDLRALVAHGASQTRLAAAPLE